MSALTGNFVKKETNTIAINLSYNKLNEIEVDMAFGIMVILIQLMLI